MIRLRDNRFGSFARSFRRMAETDRYFAPANPDFKESVIDKVSEDLWQILVKFNGKTLSQLRQISNGSLLMLGDIANDTAEQAFFQLFDPRFIPERSHPESFALETSNSFMRDSSPNRESASRARSIDILIYSFLKMFRRSLCFCKL